MSKTKGKHADMTTYTELAEKFQGEFIDSLKQAQDLSLKTLRAFSTLVAEIPVPKFDASAMPAANDVMEQSFAFANQLLETRKEYALKLAELATETQKQFADSLSRFAEASKN